MLAWEGYADQDWVKEFTAETGIDVNVVFIGSDDEIWAKIKGSEGKDFDVMAVNTAQLQRYIDAGLVTPGSRRSPTRRRCCRASATSTQDQGETRDGKVYGIPFAFDSIGLIYDTDKVKPAPTRCRFSGTRNIRARCSAYDNGEHNFSFTALTMGIADPFHLTPSRWPRSRRSSST